MTFKTGSGIVVRKATRKQQKAAAVARSLSKNQKKEVKKLVKGVAETKSASFYQDYNNGGSATRASGTFATRGWAVQNNAIVTNNTDILQLVPYVAQGLDDWNRIGQKITVSGLHVSGSIRINISRLVSRSLTVLNAYVFVWQHQQLKDYTRLYASNDFSQFLERGDGATTAFTGEQQDIGRVPARQYYKLLKVKKIKLDWAGVNAGVATDAGVDVSIANAHVWKGDYSMNLTKHLPKVLTYPESANSTTPQVLNAPTNTSLCMSIGFVLANNASQTNTPVDPLPFLEQTYVSRLTYKDM